MHLPSLARPWAAASWRWRPPVRCAICLDWGPQPACAACLARFAAPRPRCEVCALPLPVAVPRCGRCLLHPPPQSHAVAAVDYGFPWDGLIGRWKQGGDLSLTPLLAGLLREALARSEATRPAVDLVVPMPVSEGRLRERGFDHAGLLAQALDRRADASLLLRWRDTPHQTGLDRDARQANLRGAFLPAPGRRQALAARHVALVDDVMTTGASVTEVSRTLLAAGAASVQLWLLARTPD